MSDYQFFIDGHELAVGDYVIDEDNDVCIIIYISDDGRMWHIKWLTGGFINTADLYSFWAENVRRLARPEEIVVAKLKGLVL